jgi:hypothetical protein
MVIRLYPDLNRLEISKLGCRTYCKEYQESRLNNKPSFISDYYIEYKVNSKWHRIDGPARIWLNSDGFNEQWWINNKQIHCSSQEEFERLIKLKILW